ncbi:MAG TPA: hypothetical protein VGD41_20725, partial [Pyrinomonadaceae bacterium]
TELWSTDLAAGRFERLFPGQLVTQQDIGKGGQLLAMVIEADGKSRIWLAWPDNREPPKRVGNIEAATGRLGPTGEIVFPALENGALQLFRTNVDGSTPQRFAGPSGNVLGGVSPDGLWVSDWLGGELRAFSTNGAMPVVLFKGSVSRLRWTPDGSRALLAVQTGPGPSAFGFGHTYVLPLEPGSLLPRIPTGGFKTEAEIAAIPGVEVIPYGDVSFSPERGVYAFSKITVTRNLYRIPLR